MTVEGGACTTRRDARERDRSRSIDGGYWLRPTNETEDDHWDWNARYNK